MCLLIAPLRWNVGTECIYSRRLRVRYGMLMVLGPGFLGAEFTYSVSGGDICHEFVANLEGYCADS